jgi:hypothetical protein
MDWNQGPTQSETREADNRIQVERPAQAAWAPAAVWVQAVPDQAEAAAADRETNRM